jgi:hypothetical protein
MATSADEAFPPAVPDPARGRPPVIGPIDPNAFYNLRGLADLLGLQTQTLHNRRSEGRSMPAGVLVSGRLIFSGAEIVRWLATGDHPSPPTPSRRPSPNVRSKLTAAQVRQIRVAVAAGEHHGDIAARFGVTDGAISHIATGRTWGWLP